MVSLFEIFARIFCLLCRRATWVNLWLKSKGIFQISFNIRRALSLAVHFEVAKQFPMQLQGTADVQSAQRRAIETRLTKALDSYAYKYAPDAEVL